MRRFAGILGGFAMAAACASFGEGDETKAREGSDASSAEGGGAADASEDATPDAAAADAARACRGGRDAGNVCGPAAAICKKGQACCLLGPTPACVPTSSCTTTQVNCASPAECDTGLRCCQVEGSSLGTRCMTSCSFGAPLCEKDEDCSAGEHCRAPDATRQIAYWHCAACPP